MTSIMVIQSEVAKCVVDAFGPTEFRLRDAQGNLLKKGTGGFMAYVPRWSMCEESTKVRLREEGVELISIVQTSLVAGTSSLSLWTVGSCVLLGHS